MYRSVNFVFDSQQQACVEGFAEITVFVGDIVFTWDGAILFLI